MTKNNHPNLEQSIREMTRIFKPNNAKEFTLTYCRKYLKDKSYRPKLEEFVKDEMEKMKSA